MEWGGRPALLVRILVLVTGPPVVYPVNQPQVNLVVPFPLLCTEIGL